MPDNLLVLINQDNHAVFTLLIPIYYKREGCSLDVIDSEGNQLSGIIYKDDEYQVECCLPAGSHELRAILHENNRAVDERAFIVDVVEDVGVKDSVEAAIGAMDAKVVGEFGGAFVGHTTRLKDSNSESEWRKMHDTCDGLELSYLCMAAEQIRKDDSAREERAARFSLLLKRAVVTQEGRKYCSQIIRALTNMLASGYRNEIMNVIIQAFKAVQALPLEKTDALLSIFARCGSGTKSGLISIMPEVIVPNRREYIIGLLCDIVLINDYAITSSALNTLQLLGLKPSHLEKFASAIADSPQLTTELIIKLFTQINSPVAIPAVSKLISSGQAYSVPTVISYVMKVRPDNAAAIVRQALTTTSGSNLEPICNALENLRDTNALPELKDKLEMIRYGTDPGLYPVFKAFVNLGFDANAEYLASIVAEAIPATLPRLIGLLKGKDHPALRKAIQQIKSGFMTPDVQKAVNDCFPGW